MNLRLKLKDLLKEGLELNKFYQQTFENGNKVYFLPKKILNNGNYQGLKLDISGSRLKGRAKNISFPKALVSLWEPVKNIDNKIKLRFENIKEDVDNSIYHKPKDLKKIGWIVINARKNDGRPLYAMYKGDPLNWKATHRMGSARHSENSKLFYTVPIKVEGSRRFRILGDDEKWSRSYVYEKIELNK